MTIGVDCDNVINNLSESVLKVYNEDSGDDLQIRDITCYEMERFVKPEYRSTFRKYFSDKRVWDNIEVLDGCISTLEKYHSLGHDIFIVTSTYPANVPMKAEWLQKVLPFLDINKQFICIHRKQLLSGLDVLIDDCHANLDYGEYRRILLDYPWNWNYGKSNSFFPLIRCRNWQDIDKALEYLT